jgi:hypothetical protein
MQEGPADVALHVWGAWARRCMTQGGRGDTCLALRHPALGQHRPRHRRLAHLCGVHECSTHCCSPLLRGSDPLPTHAAARRPQPTRPCRCLAPSRCLRREVLGRAFLNTGAAARSIARCTRASCSSCCASSLAALHGGSDNVCRRPPASVPAQRRTRQRRDSRTAVPRAQRVAPQ